MSGCSCRRVISVVGSAPREDARLSPPLHDSCPCQGSSSASSETWDKTPATPSTSSSTEAIPEVTASCFLLGLFFISFHSGFSKSLYLWHTSQRALLCAAACGRWGRDASQGSTGVKASGIKLPTRPQRSLNVKQFQNVTRFPRQSCRGSARRARSWGAIPGGWSRWEVSFPGTWGGGHPPAWESWWVYTETGQITSFSELFRLCYFSF